MFVRRMTLLMLLILFSVALCACSGGSEQTAEQAPTASLAPMTAEPAATATEIPFETSAPTVEPTATIAVDDYEFIWKIDTALGIKYQIPSHWLLQTGERTLIYTEPVSDGETPARVSLTVKKVSSQQSSADMKKELNAFLEALTASYGNFTSESISTSIKFTRYRGYSTYYTGTSKDGIPMKGFVIMSTINKRIYCMNFSTPAARFEQMTPVGQKIMKNVYKNT